MIKLSKIKHIICRTNNNLNDIVIIDQLFLAEVICVSSMFDNEIILTMVTKQDKIIQVHLRGEK